MMTIGTTVANVLFVVANAVSKGISLEYTAVKEIGLHPTPWSRASFSLFCLAWIVLTFKKLNQCYDKLYEIKGVESLSDMWVILPQDVGITLAATVLNNGWIKCEQDTSHILVWLYYQ